MKKTLPGYASSRKQKLFASWATLLLLLISFFSFAQADTWQYTGDNLLANRSYPVSFSINGYGYVGTGRDDKNVFETRVFYKDFWQYEPSTHSWTQKAEFPGYARSEATGFSIGNKGYIGFGGGKDFPLVYNDFYEYDPVANNWNRIKDFSNGMLPRTRAAGFSIGGKGYVGTGGISIPVGTIVSTLLNIFTGLSFIDRTIISSLVPSTTYLMNDFWEYSPDTKSFRNVSDFGGSKRDGAVGFSIGNKGYVGMGGGQE
ncbi:hypothetical protein FW778_17440 [Ginsengibacter hankyongi]|uniref:N-acetylneuraminic acid mutarotase n=1 Tax=Ginsengibacter hankyongi TaxID=2607284 RepID=A0A5J5IDW1_9BACT|nr:hypothetical protein [Ginsengibacter hankyongi]KAA9037211.1 hypothetical protein FW778_17440 [Ginsengibacter hankyongi]